MADLRKPRLTKRIVLFVVAGLSIFLLYLFYFVGTWDIVDVIRQISLPYYAPAFLVFVISVFFSSITWRSLLKIIGITVSVRKALTFTWVGLFFDAVVPDPGWSGDLSKAYMLSKDTGQDGGGIGATVVAQKIIVTVITILGLFLGAVLLVLHYTLSLLVVLFVVVVLIISVSSVVILLYLSSNPKITKALLGWLVRVLSVVLRGHWNSADFLAEAEDTLNRFHMGMRSLRADPKSLIPPLCFCTISWVFDVSVVFLVFASLRFSVPVDQILIVYTLTGSLQAWGATFLGFTEIVMSGSYALLGIPLPIGVAATLMSRVVTLWFKLVSSYFAFQWTGIRLLSGQNQIPSKGNLTKSGKVK